MLNISQHLTNASTKGSKCKKKTNNFGLTEDKLRGKLEDKDGGYII